MINKWADLHPLLEDKVPCNLAYYSLITTDDDVTSVLQEGLKEAQGMLQILNMAPLMQCTNKTWFLTPWMMEKANP